MSADRAVELIRTAPKIGALPAAYLELSRLLDDPDSSNENIGRAVIKDPALTAQLLRIVNSAYFGLNRPVDRISKAVALVGREQLRHVALATSVIHMFRLLPESMISMDSFWKHSLATGLCARGLGQNVPVRGEVLFTAGLLHDVGSLVICLNRPRAARNILMECENSGRLIDEVEREVLGCDHAEVGAALLTDWGIRGPAVAATAYHHKVSMAEEHRRAVAVVHVADVVVAALQLGSSGEHLVPCFDPAAWRYAGLDVAALQSVVTVLEAEFDVITSAMLAA